MELVQLQSLNDLKTLWNGLPDPVLYLPLSKQFGLNDAGPNNYSGQYTSTRVNFVNGPSGTAESAIQTGSWTDQKFVIVGNYVPLKFEDSGGTSWTITMFSFMSMVGPMFEFDWVDPSSTSYRAHLWMHNSNDKLWFNPMYVDTTHYTMDDCTLYNTWQYVGVRYDHSAGKFQPLCDSTLFVGDYYEPQATKKVFIGARDTTSGYGCNGCQFSCFAVYREALTEAQMQSVRQMCSLWNQAITCPSECAQDSCWPDLSQTNGYRCEGCNTGWSGADCDNRKAFF